MRVVQCAYEFPLPDKVGLPETDYYCTFNFCSKAKHSRQRSRSLTRGGDLRRIGIGEQKANIYHCSQPTEPPCLPPSLPSAPKSNPLFVDGSPLLSPIATAMFLILFPPAFRRSMLWWGDCRAAP